MRNHAGMAKPPFADSFDGATKHDSLYIKCTNKHMGVAMEYNTVHFSFALNWALTGAHASIGAAVS